MSVVKLTGSVVVRLIGADGKIKKQSTHKNLVVTVGLQHVAGLLAGEAPTAMSHMAIGSGAAAPALGDTTLATELARVALDSNARTGASVAYVATFPAGTGTGTVEEAGILNAAAAGTLLARFLTGSYAKGASDALELTWTLTVA